jgi:Replication-relaxation
MNTSKSRADSLQLQRRDVALLRGLFESRVMTAKHVAKLYFDGKRPYTTKRLQKIKAAGLITERKRLPTQASVLFLTRKAFNFLKIEGHLSELPELGTNSFEARANVSERTLAHELEVMDVKAAFHAALADSDKFSILEFSTWPVLHEFRAARPGLGGKESTVRPDGFICIHEKDEGAEGFHYECFLEVDRSNEGQDVLVSKAASYRDYYQSGGYAVRNRATRADYESFPFRVMIVLKSTERRNNTAERLAQSTPRILTQAWLTTLAEVTANPLGPIWITPDDYRKLTEGTPFYTEDSNPNLPYRRQPGREAFVEANILKRRLLEG